MGYNTTLIVLNDALDQIRKDKEFGFNVAQAISKLSVVPKGHTVDIMSGNHGNAASVIESHHADMVKLISVGGNNAHDLGYVGFWQSKPEDILREYAKSLGYRIVKAKVK